MGQRNPGEREVQKNFSTANRAESVPRATYDAGLKLYKMRAKVGDSFSLKRVLEIYNVRESQELVTAFKACKGKEIVWRVVRQANTYSFTLESFNSDFFAKALVKIYTPAKLAEIENELRNKIGQKTFTIKQLAELISCTPDVATAIANHLVKENLAEKIAQPPEMLLPAKSFKLKALIEKEQPDEQEPLRKPE